MLQAANRAHNGSLDFFSSSDKDSKASAGDRRSKASSSSLSPSAAALEAAAGGGKGSAHHRTLARAQAAAASAAATEGLRSPVRGRSALSRDRRVQRSPSPIPLSPTGVSPSGRTSPLIPVRVTAPSKGVRSAAKAKAKGGEAAAGADDSVFAPFVSLSIDGAVGEGQQPPTAVSAAGTTTPPHAVVGLNSKKVTEEDDANKASGAAGAVNEEAEEEEAVIDDEEEEEEEYDEAEDDGGAEVSMGAFFAAMDAAPDWLLLDAFAMHVPAARSDRYPDLAIAPPVPAHQIAAAPAVAAMLALARETKASAVLAPSAAGSLNSATALPFLGLSGSARGGRPPSASASFSSAGLPFAASADDVSSTAASAIGGASSSLNSLRAGGSAAPVLPMSYLDAGVDDLLGGGPPQPPQRAVSLPSTSSSPGTNSNSINNSNALSAIGGVANSNKGLTSDTASTNVGLSSAASGGGTPSLSSLASATGGASAGSSASPSADGAAPPTATALLADDDAANALLAAASDQPTDEEFGEDPIAFWEVRNVVRGGGVDGGSRRGASSMNGAAPAAPRGLLGSSSKSALSALAAPLQSLGGMGSMGLSSGAAAGPFMAGGPQVDEVDAANDEDGDGGGVGDIRRDVRRRSVSSLASGGSNGSGAGGGGGPSLGQLSASGNGGQLSDLNAVGGSYGATRTFITSSGSRVTVSHTYVRPDGQPPRAIAIGGMLVGSGAVIEAFTYGELTVDAHASTLSHPRSQLAAGALIAGPGGVGGGFGLVSNSSLIGGRSGSAPSMFGGYHRASDAGTVAQRLRAIHMFYSIGHQRAVRSVAVAAADEAGDGLRVLWGLGDGRRGDDGSGVWGNRNG